MPSRAHDNPASPHDLTEQLTPARGTRERHLETLLAVSRAVGHIVDSQEAFRRIIRHVTAAFEADRSSLFLHDAATRQLWSVVAQGLEASPHALRIPDDHGLCGHVFQTLERLRLPDVLVDDRFDRTTSRATAYTPRSMIVVPVEHRRGVVAGVIQVMDRRPDYFTADDLDLLEAIAVPIGISCDNVRLYEAQKRQFDSFVRAFSAALDARDPCTQVHSINVANYAVAIALELGLGAAEQEWLRVAGLLHDVGKIGTPESILTKPGRLTPEEFEEMKRHASYSRVILGEIEFTDTYDDMASIAAAHHEKLDGSGYPDGLHGDQVPLRARILCVADIFDALTQTRHYRSSMSIERALEVIDAMTPRQLDARCVQALRAFLGR